MIMYCSWTILIQQIQAGKNLLQDLTTHGMLLESYTIPHPSDCLLMILVHATADTIMGHGYSSVVQWGIDFSRM